jgi:hypothetical protein
VTAIISEINDSATGQKNVYLKYSFSLPDGSVLKSREYASTFLNLAYYNVVNLAYNNKTIVDDYLKNSFGSQSQIKYSSDNDFISIIVEDNYSLNRVTYTSTVTRKTSWRTGWLEYQEIKTIDSNGTILSVFKVERITNDLFALISNYTIYGLIIACPIAIIGYIVYSWSKFKKSSLGEFKNNKVGSFSSYISSFPL